MNLSHYDLNDYDRKKFLTDVCIKRNLQFRIYVLNRWGGGDKTQLHLVIDETNGRVMREL